MASFYKPVSRWTKRRKVNNALKQAFSAYVPLRTDDFEDIQFHHSSKETYDNDCFDFIQSEKKDFIVHSYKRNKAENFDDSEISGSESGNSCLYCSDSSSSTDDIGLADELNEWSVQHKLSHAALDGLLEILKKRHPDLPKDSRTLLKTVSSVEVHCVAGGLYHHFGLEKCLTDAIDVLQIVDTELKLHINIDGLPLFRSCNAQFWPILGLLANSELKEPFVIGLFYGNAKPTSASVFLEQFIDEYSQLNQNGLCHNGNKYTLTLSAVICDTPARAFVKNVKSHTGYGGCDRCTQEGVYLQKRMTFPETNAPLRTNQSFISMSDEYHHLGASPLSGLSIGMVTAFPVDYMHCVCLGVMRKLIYLWLKGPVKTRLASHSVSMLSEKLNNLKSSVPCEFARRPRSVSEIDRWKATELRQFLLYTGPVCLKDILPSDMYGNFMLLSSAVRILLSKDFCHELVDYASGLLKEFVKHFGNLYGWQFVSYNVHAVIHLPEDAKQFGVLDNISGFLYENHLGKLKKLLRKPQAPLQQVVKRLSEKKMTSVDLLCCILQKPQLDTAGPLPQHLRFACEHFREYHQPGFKISVNEKDSCAIIHDRPVLVKNFLKSTSDQFVVYQGFEDVKPFFTYPFSSDRLQIFSVLHAKKDLEFAPVHAIQKKCAFLKSADDCTCVIFPLLH